MKLLKNIIPAWKLRTLKLVQDMLDEHSEEELRGLFCVVEPHRHRIRHLH